MTKDVLTPPAFQCILTCDPGYVSHLPPVVTCVKGKYQPADPRLFKCQPAVALVVTESGKLEIFSNDERCNQIISNAPPFVLKEHSVMLQVDRLLLEGYTERESRRVQLILDGVRSGILANQWTTMNSRISADAAVHDKFAYGNCSTSHLSSHPRAKTLDYVLITFCRCMFCQN